MNVCALIAAYDEADHGTKQQESRQEVGPFTNTSNFCLGHGYQYEDDRQNHDVVGATFDL